MADTERCNPQAVHEDMQAMLAASFVEVFVHGAPAAASFPTRSHGLSTHMHMHMHLSRVR